MGRHTHTHSMGSDQGLMRAHACVFVCAPFSSKSCKNQFEFYTIAGRTFWESEGTLEGCVCVCVCAPAGCFYSAQVVTLLFRLVCLLFHLCSTILVYVSDKKRPHSRAPYLNAAHCLPAHIFQSSFSATLFFFFNSFCPHFFFYEILIRFTMSL